MAIVMSIAALLAVLVLTPSLTSAQTNDSGMSVYVLMCMFVCVCECMYMFLFVYTSSYS